MNEQQVPSPAVDETCSKCQLLNMQQAPNPAVDEFDKLKSDQVETKMYEETLQSTDPEVIKKA